MLDCAGKKTGEVEENPLTEDSLKETATGSATSSSEATCRYECKDNGGCSVRIESDQPISGNVLGSCFSPSFGG